ncbi:MAG: hypothetical protein IT578_06760 [Verrucomicrobiae bacterium]|nr:hypothetical protein [Verrucomicrobiae bacterium]
MSDVVFTVERDPESGWLCASWDDPRGGGIATQGRDLRDLQDMIRDAVLGYFEDRKPPVAVRLHFISDPELVMA